jgi:hypothetical protein
LHFPMKFCDQNLLSRKYAWNQVWTKIIRIQDGIMSSVGNLDNICRDNGMLLISVGSSERAWWVVSLKFIQLNWLAFVRWL